MAHFTGPTQEQPAESAAVIARNTRVGLWLFVLYLALYAGFVLLTAFRADWMRTEASGVNVAILYGLGLIGGALVLAAVYLWICRAASSQ
jgi:uncharacterized membrane protein (DUF485 family)